MKKYTLVYRRRHRRYEFQVDSDCVRMVVRDGPFRVQRETVRSLDPISDKLNTIAELMTSARAGLVHKHASHT